MGVDAGVSCCASEVLAISVRDVLAIRIFVALGQPKVNDENAVLGLLRPSDQEVVWLDVPMDNPLVVHLLNPLQLYPYFSPTPILLTIWMAMRRTVLRSNWRLQDWKMSSRLGPSRSITITWNCLFSYAVSVPT